MENGGRKMSLHVLLIRKEEQNQEALMSRFLICYLNLDS